MGDNSSYVSALIQVVDDDPVTRLLMRSSLEKEGFRVAEAENGLNAVAEFEKLNPSVVILDVMMPKLNGYETCRAIRKTPGGEYTPILMVTGLEDIDSIHRSFDAGATDFISKPINWPVLNYRIKYMLRASEAFCDVIYKQNQIQELAFFDHLTGLANRSMFKDSLEIALSESALAETQLAVLFMDLDRFKTINDSLGHLAGDVLLKNVAERIRACLRESDTFGRLSKKRSKNYVSRLGGDEFTLMLPHLKDPEDAGRVARRVNAALSKPFQLEDQEVFITASIGISIFPLDGTEAELLLKHADLAMYHAKERGKNGFQFYKKTLNAKAEKRLEFENDVHRAVASGEFTLHYQPQFSLHDGRISGAEALCRWKHESRGMVSPALFIPVIEELGLITPFTDWVIREVGSQLATWKQMGLPLKRIALNISSKNLDEQKIPDKINKILKDYNLEAKLLELELTESVLAKKDEDTLAILKHLKDMGLTISVDDFGTGYSSLSYLKIFPVDVVKIDHFFIRDILTSAQDASIVQAIIAMAHSIGMQVIAEGIEGQGQLDLLQTMGCEYGQGFLFSPAVPAERFEEMLGEKHKAFPLSI